ncbi:MAG: 3-ketoacyl-CoA thiolase [Parachlamydiaceae bacterium]|nr:3-ketoacyl-CoA thiolase [Parachlamydiaceae bacterium]
MTFLRKKVYVAAGYTTTFFGSGRKEFDPSKPMPKMETYLLESAKGTSEQIPNPKFDEGYIGSFMAARFLHQANLPGFLPFMIPALLGKPCTAVEGACGTGGRVIACGMRSILSDLSDSVFIAGFEIQNSVKAVYGADILAGASYYAKERKDGDAFFFPGVFSKRAAAYLEKYGSDLPRKAMAKWYEQAILNARKNPKAQEFHNTQNDLLGLAVEAPDAANFVPDLNYYDCSKVSDGASSLTLFSEEGLFTAGIKKEDALEIVAIGEAVGDITVPPINPSELVITAKAVQQALETADISLDEIGWLEIHDCFSITALLALEAIGLAPKGQGAAYILEGNTQPDGKTPTNLSGGLIGFGHPTGATGVRQMVDLLMQLTGKAENQVNSSKPYGMMISMGGNDITVTCLIVKRAVK